MGKNKGYSRAFILLSVLYWELGITDLVFIACKWDGRVFVKPLLLISLSILFYVTAKNNYTAYAKRIQAALFFSFAGDTVLLFATKSELYFMAGLMLFLLAHLFYITAFYKLHTIPVTVKNNTVTKKTTVVAVFLLYMLIIMGILKNHLGGMFIPVSVYTLVITIMGISAALNKLKFKNKLFRFILTGSLLFIVSDTLLAFEKFVQPFPFSGVAIMLTYISAQYLIVFGSVKYLHKKIN